MKPEKPQVPVPHERTYPIRCVECSAKQVRPVVVSRTVQKSHDGRIYDLDLPALSVTKCGKCGEVFFGKEADEQISAALRAKLELLSPDEIRAQLEKLRLNQKQAAEQLGIAPETLSRWLAGSMIQSKAMDRLLRLFFGVPQAREFLSAARGTHSSRGAAPAA